MRVPLTRDDLSTDLFSAKRRYGPANLRQIGVLSGLGLILLLAGLWQKTDAIGLAAMTSGTALVLTGLTFLAVKLAAHQAASRNLSLIRQVTAESATPCLVSDSETSSILWANRAAREFYDLAPGMRMDAILSEIAAAPESLVQRLQDHACATGNAVHEVQIGPEQRRHSVQRLRDGQLFWSVERSITQDARDTLPFAFAEFDSDGVCSYASAAMITCLGHKPCAPEDLYDAHLPDPGQVAKAANSLTELGMSVLRLHDVARRTETYIMLPEIRMIPPDQQKSARDASSIDTMPVAIAHLDSDGTISYLNMEARRLLQWPTEDALLISDILEGLGRPVTEWLADIADGRPHRATEVLRLTRGDGETYLKVTLVRQQDRAVARSDVIAVLSDVTELKSLEAKFTQSQKMQAIGQLAGGVAHDFNNLLTAISGHCDLLLLRHDKSDLDYPDLMQILQNTNRAAALVRQLLALSRQQTLKFVTLDLHETMDDVIHLLNRLVGEKVTLSLHHGAKVAPIRSDKRQFEQVLMNLVVNARDALPMGGEIRIETETRTLPQGFAHDHVTLPAGEYTIIRIRDDGIGIPATLLPKIFDPFFTTKRLGEGTGLGLSTVYGIVKQSGGYIFCDSEEGQGTTFTLYFKAQDAVPERSPEARGHKLHGAAALKSRRALVLLVEDEAPVRSFAARALELQGHRVIEADCGEAALEILDNPDIKPDVFVTDVIMPGIDGPGWVARVRERFPDTPVLFMSGYAEDSRVAAQARIGNAAFLGKPFSLSELTSLVNDRLLQESDAA